MYLSLQSNSTHDFAKSCSVAESKADVKLEK
jgi:hypothetical protein